MTSTQRRTSGPPPSRIALLAMAAALLAAGPLAGCMVHGGAPQRTTRGAPPAKHSRTKEEAGQRAAYWKDELREVNTIPQLWDALNRHQDELGRSLALLERSTVHRVILGVPARPTGPQPPPPERRRPGATVPAPPTDARATGRQSGTGLCHRACRHVAAICYAASRICRIASRLGDWAAQQACTRATDRCREARQTARGRCPRCPAG